MAISPLMTPAQIAQQVTGKMKIRSHQTMTKQASQNVILALWEDSQNIQVCPRVICVNRVCTVMKGMIQKQIKPVMPAWIAQKAIGNMKLTVTVKTVLTLNMGSQIVQIALRADIRMSGRFSAGCAPRVILVTLLRV
jgi:hypothetical protein